MRIAMPSDDQRALAGHPGRCAGFVVVDLDDGAVAGLEWRPNTFTAHVRGGGDSHEERHARVLAALADCQMLIARGMGKPLHDRLAEAGIAAYTTDLPDIEAVVAAVLDGGLTDLPELRCDHDHDHEHH